VSQSLIGLTIVAIGTSLPELATSAMAAYKKQSDIAIGNVVGSNIFNIFWILGLSSIVKPLPFNQNSQIDVMMTIFASLVLFILLMVGKRHVIEKWQGVLMILIYIGYLVFLISNS
jgi:cation:H+ antiporter